MTPEEAIRRALEASAATVEVSPDALATIRGRVRRRRRTARWGWATAGLAAAAAAAAVVALPAAPPAPRPAPPATTTSGTPGGALLAVYWIGPGGGLVREFTRQPAGTPEERARAALTRMLDGRPADPDYATAWPAGTRVRAVAVADGVTTVDLAGSPPSTRAAQQLVWTVTAATGQPEVRIGPGGPVLRRGPAVDTLAPVWIINPQHGERVPTGGVAVHVAAFGREVRLRVRAASGAVVVDRVLALSPGAPAQGEARVTLALDPGAYTLEAAAGGAVDDHAITVG